MIEGDKPTKITQEKMDEILNELNEKIMKLIEEEEQGLIQFHTC